MNQVYYRWYNSVPEIGGISAEFQDQVILHQIFEETSGVFIIFIIIIIIIIIIVIIIVIMHYYWHYYY